MRLRGSLLLTFVLLASMACGLGAQEPLAQAPPADEPAPEEAPAEPAEPLVMTLPAATALPTPTAPPAVPQVDPLTPGITEARWVWLDYPTRLKTGGTDLIRLRFEIEGDQITPTLSDEGREVTGETVEIPDVYETHDVVVLASLRAAGLQVEPRGEVGEPLLPGQPVEFRWSISAPEPSDHIVTVSLRLRFLPRDGGASVERTYWAQELSIQARDVLGLRSSTATWIGSLGSAAGTVLGFPYFKELLDWLRKRTRRGAV